MQPCGRNDNREHDEVDEHAFPATKLFSRNSMQQPDATDEEFLCIGILKIRISIYTFIQDIERTIVIVAFRSQ